MSAVYQATLASQIPVWRGQRNGSRERRFAAYRGPVGCAIFTDSVYDASKESEDAYFKGNQRDQYAENLTILSARSGLSANPAEKQTGEARRGKNEKSEFQNKHDIRGTNLAHIRNKAVERDDDADGEKEEASQRDSNG